MMLDQPDAQLHALAQTLSPDEHHRAQQFATARDQRHFIAARGCLRSILGRYTAMPPQQLQFTYGVYGKPMLADTCNRDELQFNLAHSRGFALYAITHQRHVGIDLERLRRLVDFEGVVRHVCSPEEQAALHMLPLDKRDAAFFACWTRKEAFLKATGKGFTLPLNHVTVSVLPQEQRSMLRIVNDPAASQRWTVYDLAPIPQYAAALVIDGQIEHLACWAWTPE